MVALLMVMASFNMYAYINMAKTYHGVPVEMFTSTGKQDT